MSARLARPCPVSQFRNRVSSASRPKAVARCSGVRYARGSGATAPLPRAYRTPLHLATAFGQLAELTRFLNWLTGQGLASLADIDGQRCEAYLAHRRYVRDENDVVVGELSPATRRAAAQTIVDLVNHRELFTLDRVSAHLRPWGGAAPSAVAEMPCGTGQNKTAPVNDRTRLRRSMTCLLYTSPSPRD